MNINKIIFSILGGIITVLLVVLAINLQNSGGSDPQDQNTRSDISIWILEDDEGDFRNIISNFTELYPDYKGKSITVESFSDLGVYRETLSSAFLQNRAPDIFVLKSSEISVHENMIRAIDPSKVSPNDFRLRYAPVFGNDLILSDPNDPSSEFLKGVPIGFEALGLFYNRKYYPRSGELETWTSINKEIQALAKKYSRGLIPLALGDGTGVSRSPQAISTLLTLEDNASLRDVDANELRDVIAMYQALGDSSGDNPFNDFSDVNTKTDIELFSEGKLAAIAGYPRDIIKIDNAGYQKSFLFASPFPYYAGKDPKTAIEYSYLSINKNSPNTSFANDFLAYISSLEGQRKVLETYPYYLSAETSLYDEMLEKKILSSYNVIYKNFVPEGGELVSFGVENSVLYDTRARYILDMEIEANKEFESLSDYLICGTQKHSTLSGLSSSCK